MLLAAVMTAGPRVLLDASYSVFDLVANPATAGASFSLENVGDVSKTTSSGSTDLGDWVRPKGAAPGSYECRATLNSGVTPSGTLGSWLALTSTRTWGLVQSTIGSTTCVLTVEIRRGTTVLATSTVTLNAEVF